MRKLFAVALAALVAVACDGVSAPDSATTDAQFDVTINKPVDGDFIADVRYSWSTCATPVVPVGGVYTVPANQNNICLFAQVLKTGGGDPPFATKGQVVWFVCRTSRQGFRMPAASCESGSGVWVKDGGGIKVDPATGTALKAGQSTNRSCPAASPTAPSGHKFKFKGGGQVKAGESAPFDIRVDACA